MRRMVSSLFLLLLLPVAMQLWAQQPATARFIVELAGSPDLSSSVAAEAGAGQRSVLREQIQRSQEEFRNRLRGIPGSRATFSITELMNAVAVEAPAEQAQALRELPGVAHVYPVVWYRPDMDSAPAVHHAPQAWLALGGQDLAGAGVKVAVLDSCIEVSHPALQDPLLPIPPGYPLVNRPDDLAYTSNKVIVTRNYRPFYGVPGELTPRPFIAHATQVASVIAGVPHASPRGAFSGIAPKAWLGNYCMSSPDSADTLFRSDVIAKAIDDAVADGMDVINLSLGSATRQLRPEDDIVTKMVERAALRGVIVTQSAGNNGPSLSTIGNMGSTPGSITVGATWNSRVWGALATVGGADYVSIPSADTGNQAPISGPIVDVRALDGTGFGCGTLPAGSLNGSIAFLTLGGGCNTSVKTTNAQAAGALAALIAGDDSNPDLFSMSKRVIPAVAVSQADGEKIRSRLTSPTQATLRFQSVSIPYDSTRLASFSSRGPTGTHLLKPDLSAVGAALYLAALNGSYETAQGTSFSAPIVAGAAAILKAARPGLSVEQYKSLLIHSADRVQTESGEPARLILYGAGILNIEAALKSTVAVTPVSLSWGAVSGGFDKTIRLLVMNLGRTNSRFQLRVAPHRPGPAPELSQTFLDIEAGGGADGGG